jgi:hypothetical protein
MQQDELGINRETFHNWKKKFPELANAVKAGKEVSDSRVEKALYLIPAPLVIWHWGAKVWAPLGRSAISPPM